VIAHLTVEEPGDKAVMDSRDAQELMGKLGGKADYRSSLSWIPGAS